MKYAKGIFAGAVTAVLGIRTAAAQFTDTVGAGNGGVATASGSGGAVSAADVNSGGNAGSAIAVGNTNGPDPDVNGGDILNQTGLAVQVDGGTAIADATGGNNNLAFVS
jgi:hypothetical protein